LEEKAGSLSASSTSWATTWPSSLTNHLPGQLEKRLRARNNKQAANRSMYFTECFFVGVASATTCPSPFSFIFRPVEVDRVVSLRDACWQAYDHFSRQFKPSHLLHGSTDSFSIAVGLPQPQRVTGVKSRGRVRKRPTIALLARNSNLPIALVSCFCLRLSP